jgi:nickel/cobalt exporter
VHVPSRPLILVALLLAALCGASTAWAQNPFAPPPPGGGTAARPAAPGSAVEGGSVPGFLRPVTDRIAGMQRELNRTMSRELRAVRDSGSPRALLVVAGIAFLYGVLHAAGPGHGKLVVSSFFLAREARIVGGILAGTAISFLQAFTSIVLVGLLAVILGGPGLDVLGRSVWVEAFSYGLIVVIGVAIAVSAVRGHHHHEHDAQRTGLGLVIAAGLTPCASALIIMLFALTHGVLLVGILATLIMAVGMAITVSLVGMATILGRRTLLVALPGSERARTRVATGLTATGGALIAFFGTLLLAGAWARLG